LKKVKVALVSVDGKVPSLTSITKKVADVCHDVLTYFINKLIFKILPGEDVDGA
jgi:hypothetical protein|tara:strand:- start:542 stop:703 length:162 start_codon:yes stop_codon:yes gene_type:complete